MNIIFYSGIVNDSQKYRLFNKHILFINTDMLLTITMKFGKDLVASIPPNSALELYDVIPQTKTNRDIQVVLEGLGASFQFYNFGKDN